MKNEKKNQALTYARNVYLQKKAKEDARQREIRAILATRKDSHGEDGQCDTNCNWS